MTGRRLVSGRDEWVWGRRGPWLCYAVNRAWKSQISAEIASSKNLLKSWTHSDVKSAEEQHGYVPVLGGLAMNGDERR